jgi:hypothetical protein
MSPQTEDYNRESSAALIVTFGTMTVFIIIIALSPYFLHPLNLSFFAENIETFGSADTRPQRLAYLGAMAFLGGVALFDITSVIARHLPKWIARGSNFSGNRARPNHYSWIFSGISIATLLVCLLFTFKFVFSALKVNCIPSVIQSSADPHIYAVLAEKGEGLLRRGEDAIASAYGMFLPSLYSIGARNRIRWDYLNIFRLIFSLNVAFVSVWLFSAYQLLKHRYTLFFLGFLLLGPLARIIIFSGSDVLHPNLSAYRYIPFALLFLCCAVAGRQPLPLKITGAAILAALGVFISQDSGLVAIFGFLAFILLHDILDLRAFSRAAAFVFAASAALVVLQLILKTVGIDLLGSLILSFSAAASGYAGKALDWLDPTWIVAIINVYFFALCATRARRGVLPPETATAAVLSSVTLLWFLYYIYRPSESYWIYAATFFPVAGSLWLETTRRDDFILSGALLVAVAIFSYSSIGVTRREVEFTRGFAAFSAAEDATAVFGGICTSKNRATALESRKVALEKLAVNMIEIQPITALPFASLQNTPQTRLPIDAIFDFSSPQLVEAWRWRLCRDMPQFLVFDGPGLSTYAKSVADKTKSYTSNSVSDLYERVEATDFIEIWQKRASPTICDKMR